MLNKINYFSTGTIYIRIYKSNIYFEYIEKTENSSRETQESAKVLSEFIGSNHYEWTIDSEVKRITDKISKKTDKKS